MKTTLGLNEHATAGSMGFYPTVDESILTTMYLADIFKDLFDYGPDLPHPHPHRESGTGSSTATGRACSNKENRT